MHKKFDPKVFQLGYVALNVVDLEKSKEHYLSAIGMTETARGDDVSIYLSIGYNSHDIVSKGADQRALLHVGYQLKLGLELDEFAK